MRALLKVITFVILSVLASQYVLSSFDYGGSQSRTTILIVIALTLLYYFLKPVLVIIGLPHRGLGFAFLLLVMTSLVLYVLTVFLPDFYIRDTTISNLNIFGFVLPSKHLTGLWSGIFSALVISIVYTYLDWLGSKK
ncbi:phage holin family protein [Patescibacteria group bacterium]|nr:phage holin family protein [Patescibacteria group bacterium]